MVNSDPKGAEIDWISERQDYSAKEHLEKVEEDCWCHLWKQFNYDTALQFLLWMGLYWYLLYPLSLSSCMVIFPSWSSPPINWLHVCTWISECFWRKITQPSNYSHFFLLLPGVSNHLWRLLDNLNTVSWYSPSHPPARPFHTSSSLSLHHHSIPLAHPGVSITLQFLCAIRWQVPHFPTITSISL